MSSSKLTTKKINYCTNCGKYGHSGKKCSEPITSLGIICIMIDGLPISIESFGKFLNEKYVEIDNYNFSKIDNIDKLDMLKKNIKFLMIQRKHSLAYIEFIRGKYEIIDSKIHIAKTKNNSKAKDSKIKNIISSKNDLIRLFQNMSPEEINEISKLNFDNLWNNLWKKTSKNKIFQKEYENSKLNFNKLIETGIINDLINIKPLYKTPEWGFPKGRRNLFEKNLECALREFNEETGISNENIYLINKINCIIEEYTGSNMINYKHIYYLALCDQNNINIEDFSQTDNNYEVGNIGWYSWEEATEMIRSNYTEKIKVLNQIYFLFLNLYMDYKESLKLKTNNSRKMNDEFDQLPNQKQKVLTL